MFNIISGRSISNIANTTTNNFCYNFNSIRIYSKEKIKFISKENKFPKFVMFGSFLYKNQYFKSNGYSRNWGKNHPT